MPLTYLLVPLLLVFLILSMLVVVEVVRDTGSAGVVAVAVVRTDLLPVVTCQMLRSGRGRRDAEEDCSVRG
ncbi:hypothetical protein [Actimicrobium antarcticum]|uniref:hypothetical protein n=1 Tax=Actimicrobium antarcticum TaxID=1051899 RepID=UPI0031E0EBD9